MEQQTLGDLLYKLTASDEGLINLTPESSAELMADLSEKVDSYLYILEKMGSEIDRLAKRADEILSARKTLQNNKESLKNLMMFHMKSKGFEKLPGKEHVVSLTTRKSIEWNLDENPDATTKRLWPTFVNNEYSWNKRALTEAIKNFPSQYQDLGKLIDKQYLKFQIRKDLE